MMILDADGFWVEKNEETDRGRTWGSPHDCFVRIDQDQYRHKIVPRTTWVKKDVFVETEKRYLFLYAVDSKPKIEGVDAWNESDSFMLRFHNHTFFNLAVTDDVTELIECVKLIQREYYAELEKIDQRRGTWRYE